MQTVLVAVEDSAQGRDVLEYAFKTYSNATFIALSVIDPKTRSKEYLAKTKVVQWLQQKRQTVTETQQTLTELAAEHDVSVTPAVAYGRTAESVVAHSEQESVDQIVVGRRLQANTVAGRLSDVVPRIIRQASVPVTVVRTATEQNYAAPPRSVLVPVDGSARATSALEHACTVFPDAAIVALTVRNTIGEFFDEKDTTAWEQDAQVDYEQELNAWQTTITERSETILRTARERAAEHGIELETVTAEGLPVAKIIDYVEDQEIDHLYMGRTGRTSYERLLLGSTTIDVLRRCPVPVTVVPQPPGSAA